MLKARGKMEEGMLAVHCSQDICGIYVSEYAAVDSSSEADAISIAPIKETGQGIVNM